MATKAPRWRRKSPQDGTCMIASEDKDSGTGLTTIQNDSRRRTSNLSFIQQKQDD
jgi:hypothetical protein